MSNSFKILILILVLSKARLLGQVYSFPDDYNSDNSREKLRVLGLVKSVKKRSWFVNPNDTINIKKGNVYRGHHDVDDYTWFFNAKGFLISEKKMDDEKQKDYWRRNYEYDSLNHLLAVNSGEKPGDPIIKYVYNQKGQLISDIYPETIKKPSRDSLIYDKKERLIRSTRYEDYDYKKMKEFYTDYFYDNTGRKTKEIFHTKKDTLTIRTITYSKSIRTETLHTLHESKEPTFIIDKYDSFDNVLESVMKYEGEKEPNSKIVYMYTKEGLIAGSREFRNGKFHERLDYKYEYDENGNWIKCVIYENNKPHCIHEREITYH